MQVYQTLLALLGATTLGVAGTAGVIALVNRNRTGEANVFIKKDKVHENTIRNAKFYNDIIEDKEINDTIFNSLINKCFEILEEVKDEKFMIKVEDNHMTCDTKDENSVDELLKATKGDPYFQCALLERLSEMAQNKQVKECLSRAIKCLDTACYKLSPWLCD